MSSLVFTIAINFRSTSNTWNALSIRRILFPLQEAFQTIRFTVDLTSPRLPLSIDDITALWCTSIWAWFHYCVTSIIRSMAGQLASLISWVCSCLILASHQSEEFVSIISGVVCFHLSWNHDNSFNLSNLLIEEARNLKASNHVIPSLMNCPGSQLQIRWPFRVKSIATYLAPRLIIICPVFWVESDNAVVWK